MLTRDKMTLFNKFKLLRNLKVEALIKFSLNF